MPAKRSHAQNHRSPAPEVRGAIESRADRGGERPLQGRREQLRAAGRPEGPRLAAAGRSRRKVDFFCLDPTTRSCQQSFIRAIPLQSLPLGPASGHSVNLLVTFIDYIYHVYMLLFHRSQAWRIKIRAGKPTSSSQAMASIILPVDGSCRCSLSSDVSADRYNERLWGV